MKELTELKNEFYEVMYKYEKSFSEEGVMANLTAWQTAKADLLSLLRRHPNWNEDEQAIIFDCNQALSIHPDMVDETAFTLLDIASEILSGEQLEDFRTALHAAVSGYSCTVSEENLEILRQRGGIRCAKDQKASRIIGKLCKKYGVDRHTRYNAVFAQLADALNPLTINGPIFALIALDMGNYTIPENALWTRDKLLETILTHKYLSDGFGLDMVTMLMQSIAPYQDDPVYGERVTAKLWEGFGIVMDSFGTDPFDNPFGVQWGGVYTSEGASQIICALSAMGVDVHTDVRLNNGKDSVLTSFLNYADFDEGYFAHSNTTPKNAMATYQGCYATQWYLGFLKGGGAGHPYSLYYHRFDFSRKLSTEADITSFTLEGKQGVFTTEGRDNIITVTLPAGTPLNDMHPQLQLSDYATILAPDLTGGITFVKDTKTAFTVQAEDGKTTKTYYVVVKLSDEEKPSGAEIYTDTIMLKDANILRDLDILGKNITAGTDSTDIELLLDAGKDTSNLMIYARLSYGATASPALDGKKGMNLSDWTTFTITSGDGTNTRTYRIKATARTQASISAFSLTIGGTVYEGVIDDKANTITVSGVDDSNLSSTSFAPDVTLGPETLVCSPAPGLAQDFSRTVQYIVAGNEKVLSRTYTVSVLNKAGKLISGSGGGGGSDPVTPATGAKITAFSVLGVDGVINQSVGTITVTLPAGTNVTAVAPSVTVTAGAVVSPVSGEVVNLTAPVVYTVTLGEETSRYTVTVTFERSVSQQLWDELGNNSDVADHQTSHTKRDWS